MNKQIIMYGAEWCGDCQRAKAVFAEFGINYDYIITDNNPEATELVMKLNNGNTSIPIIVFPDNSIQVEPSYDELTDKLKSLQLI